MDRNSDLFTSLPETILILILSFLPLEEAAKVSLLTKRCKKVWDTFFKVELDENSFAEEVRGGERKLSRRAFIEFADRLVLYGDRSKLHLFRLKMSKPNDDRPVVERLIQFVVATRNVESLDLDFSSIGQHQDNRADFVLPPFLFQNSLLKVLKLTACNLMQLEAANFSVIKRLVVAQARLSSQSLKTLIAGCPRLEALSLEECTDLGFIEIGSRSGAQLRNLTIIGCTPLDRSVMIRGAPNLQSFKFSGSMTNFQMGWFNSLEDAYLDFGVEREFYEWSLVLCDLIRSLFHATVLSVCSYTIQGMVTGEVQYDLMTALNIRHLILNIGLYTDELPGVALMLRSCYALERLTIEMGHGINLNGYREHYPFDPREDGWPFWESQMIVPFPCLQGPLRFVKMSNFRETENAIRMVEFLLIGAMRLQELTIEMSPDARQEEYNRTYDMLRFFTRSSPDVQVIIMRRRNN